MPTRFLSVSKFIIVALIAASLLVSVVSPAFAAHNRLRQGPYPSPYYYYYYNPYGQGW